MAEAVAVSLRDPRTPRQRHVACGRHGNRRERRTLEASTEVVDYLDWPHLGQVCRMEREVTVLSGRRAGERTREYAYALTSLTPERADAKRLLHLWRGHWQIENGLHYVRDVTLDEDRAPIRCRQAPLNMAVVRNTVLGLIRVAGAPNVAAALRRHAMYPAEALALLGLTL